MKREDAINQLQDAIDGYKEFLTDEALNTAIKALKQESMLEKIKADLEKLANDEWNTKVGSVSHGLECALEIIEAYQEGR